MSGPYDALFRRGAVGGWGLSEELSEGVLNDFSFEFGEHFQLDVLTFQPLDLKGYQKEKALLYVSLRDAYERLYRYAARRRGLFGLKGYFFGKKIDNAVFAAQKFAECRN